MKSFTISARLPETCGPRASTPLYDAMDGTGAESRPDGLRETAQQSRVGGHPKYGWQLVFLSADREAMVDAPSLGIDPQSSLAYVKSKAGSDKPPAIVLAKGRK
ncbi:MAG: hypothetical protein RMI89_00470 [Gloeomargarita sp. SKYBB_i_bin120]|nr:hypothetical protein [Gloeomargarita sp. SKYG98]MCS7291435.1 hypothetical protein [Gloeomargarita sp. SKYB120]MDW8176995.1 hypothetical protein [Gloeomargarita sp. SKYBB_i_bin120]